MNIEEKINYLVDKWSKKLRLVPFWDIKIEIVHQKDLNKTGDFKIDCEDHKVIFIFNQCGSDFSHLEETIVHELLHLKLYPLDQTTESLIEANFEKDSSGYNFAYITFMKTLEQTVEELTKCFLFEFGEDKELSFGRCNKKKSFNELFDGLKNLE
ncbi:MAG: hypothetical protein SO253_00680 [Bacilli bacterium]|nr:hypothetical protein [Bacilli bacterium]